MQDKKQNLSLHYNPYPIESFRITKGIKFPKAKRHLSQCHARASSPSPNQYKFEMYEPNKTSPKFSFGRQTKFFLSRKQMKCKTQIPGPGSYKNILKNKKQTTIPQADRLGLQIDKVNPGVGSYQIQNDYLKKKIAVKFPQQKRQSVENISFGPGPNKYLIDAQKQKNLRETFTKQKKLHLKLDNIPGVGQYSIQKFTKNHSPCASIGLSRRQQRRYHSIDAPGPANYTSCSVEKYKAKSKKTSVIFNKAKKQSSQNQELLPGPADYNIAEKRKKIKGGILTSRCFYQHTEEIPGPANYQPKLDLITEKSRTARIGKSQRFKQKREISPGAGQYHPQNAKIHFNSSGFTFSKKQRILD